MKAKHFIYLLLLLAFAWRCTPEDATQTTTNDPESFTRVIDSELEAEFQELLAQAKNGVNTSVQQRAGGRIVVLPAGSVNALQNAVHAANGGIVLIRTGEHHESGTVTIDRQVTIISEAGATLITPTTPSPPTIPFIDLQPAIYILNAPDVYLGGLEIRPEGEAGNTGILVENSPRTKLVFNKITQYQFGIILEKSNHTKAYHNTVETTSLWQTGDLIDVYGIINVNGEDVRINSNDIAGAMLGIWACSSKGFASGNYLHDNIIGLLLCKAPDNIFEFPDGHLNGSQLSGNRWSVSGNNAAGNFDAGYIIIDGANNNLVKNNWASNNARVDYEVAGDSYRFGFFTPKAFDNTLYVNRGQTVKDCGVNSTIVGGTRIDTNAEPCF